MPNEKFKSAYEKIKGYLGKSLTAENTDEITDLSKELDTMKESMEKEEKDHTETKNKLVDYVKSTSFKVDEKTEDPLDDSPKTMREAEEIAMKKLLDNRKKKDKEKEN